MRNWHPFIADALGAIAGSGVHARDRHPARAAVLHGERAEVRRGRPGGDAAGIAFDLRRARTTITRCCSRRSPNGSARRRPADDEDGRLHGARLPERVIAAGDPYLRAGARDRTRRGGARWRRAVPPSRSRAPGARRNPGSAPISAISSVIARPPASRRFWPCRSGSSATTPRSSSTSTCRRQAVAIECGVALRRTESLNDVADVHLAPRGSGAGPQSG